MSVIVPFHKNLAHLERCLKALRAASQTAEIIVAADGAVDDCRQLVAEVSGRMLEIPGPLGPAVARNRGATSASGDILVFIDADVEIAPDALRKIAASFHAHPQTAALFGAYDESPEEQNLVSQYKNLAHSHVHQSSLRHAESFWAGLGAIRAEVFGSIGGFDERFDRPSIEDIDLGYRLSQEGHQILLDPSIRGCHLKRWDLRSVVTTDVRDRGIPWTQLILRSSVLQNDLNVRWTDRASVVLSYAALVSMILSLAGSPVFALAAIGLLGAFLALNRGFYKFFATRRGIRSR